MIKCGCYQPFSFPHISESFFNVINEILCTAEYKSLRLTFDWLQEQSFSLADLKDPGVFKPLGIGIMMMLLQQLTGINAIMFYAETIFEQAHFKVSFVNEVHSFNQLYLC